MTALPRLHAPESDGAVLAVPRLEDVGALLDGNRRRLESNACQIFDRSLLAMRSAARQEVLSAARNYHQDAGEAVPELKIGPLLAAGHQPELFHPGVWIKNFALQGLARRHQGVALNLIVDNDIAKTNLLRLPTETSAGSGLYHLQSLSFDRIAAAAPYEERVVHDEALFSSVPERFRELTRPWPFDAILPAFWDEVMRQARRTRLLGERFASARRALERRWGCYNFEVPLSRVCATESFGRFVCHLLNDLPRFHRLYNETVHAYRTRYGLRSRNHPVPDLAIEGDWLEAPFWVWRAGQGRRSRLFARLSGGVIELRSGAEAMPSLSAGSDGLPDWPQYARDGWTIRTRALTTTLFVRVFLCDLFMHGIGGGKYDELTDVLIREFYGLEPPDFLVVSATIRLPFPLNREANRNGVGLRHELRDLIWNPQRHLPSNDGSWREEIEAKQRWIDFPVSTRAERRERFAQIRSANDRLSQRVADRRRLLEEELTAWEARAHSEAVLRRRDYAFCLYPEEMLASSFQRFLEA